MMIREKAMFFSSFAFLFYAFTLMTALRFNLIQLSAIDAISLLVSLMISTISISMVVLAKRY